MSTYERAPDQYIIIKGTKFAYRRFGLTNGIPLFLHMHFRGTMDHWDPAFVNPLASQRPIIILDSAGVGRSEGEIPTTFAGWAQVVIDLLLAVGMKEVDVFGFSMGGAAAQMIALNAPHNGLKVRKLILAGTVQSIGEGVKYFEGGETRPYDKLRLAKTKEEQLEAFLLSFFHPTEKSQAAGRASFERIHSARSNRTDYVDVEKAKMQGLTMLNFWNPDKKSEGSYERFHELTQPVLIANGKQFSTPIEW